MSSQSSLCSVRKEQKKKKKTLCICFTFLLKFFQIIYFIHTMVKNLTLFMHLILIATSICHVISFPTLSLTSQRGEHHHHRTIKSSLNDDNEFKLKMKNILMRCEMVTPTFLTQNKYSHLRNHLCLAYFVQRLMHVKRQRDQLEDYFTFRQG